MKLAMKSNPGDDGIILVTVIWLLALLGGLAAAMSIYMTSALSAVEAYGDRPRAQAAVEAGVAQAVSFLLAGDSAPRGTTRVGEASVSWRAVNEAARIDINLARPELLAGLLARLGAPASEAAGYAQAIVALRGLPPATPATPGRPAGFDPDEEQPAHIAAAARGGQPKPGEADPHKPFADVIQLQQVPGLPPALMARAAPFLTTFSGMAEVDPLLAAPEVIEALPGMTRERVRTLLDLRGRTTDSGALADALGEAKALATAKKAAATRVSVGVTLADGFTTQSEVVIVHYADDRRPYRVLAWDDDVDMRNPPAKGAPP